MKFSVGRFLVNFFDAIFIFVLLLYSAECIAVYYELNDASFLSHQAAQQLRQL